MWEQPTPNQAIEDFLKFTSTLDEVTDHIIANFESYEQSEIEMRYLPILHDFINKQSHELSLRELLEKAQIFYINRLIERYEVVVDALERPLRFINQDNSRSIVLLIDLYRHANWAHPCWIVSVTTDNRTIQSVLNDFPPMQNNEQQLVRYR